MAAPNPGREFKGAVTIPGAHYAQAKMKTSRERCGCGDAMIMGSARSMGMRLRVAMAKGKTGRKSSQGVDAAKPIRWTKR